MTGNQDPLQFALFKAAKIGNIKLMREFIEAGADPFLLDTENCNAYYICHEEQYTGPEFFAYGTN